MAQPDRPSPRYVIFHRPGPAWQPGVSFRDQVGVRAHVDHYNRWHAAGKLVLGGPFLMADAGGMTPALAARASVITTRDVTPRECEDFAGADPAVLTGLLVYEVRAWHTPFEQV